MSPTYDPSLLPAPSVSERCAVHAERIGLDPGGTALRVDELLVVDVPLPWPKPVWAKAGFTAVPELVADAGDAGRRVRVLAAVPLADGVGRVVSHRIRPDGTFDRAEHHVTPPGVAELLQRLLVDGLDASPASVVDTEPVREYLLCTQGSHDLCCGARGASMQAALSAVDPTLAIRRVSHTGGHRMAPTGITLPDGRMWGMTTVEEMAAILRHGTTPAAVAQRCRGWMGAAAGPAQMAERAVMADVDDWSFDSTPRSSEVVAEGAITTVEVRTPDHTWRVEVEPGREVPTIACGEPGGLPAKPGAEWWVRSVNRVG